MTKEGLLALLERTIDAVKADDSCEGRITYAWGSEPHTYVVNAAVRVGNSQGQGGMIFVQEKQDEV
jgi:hypothetical protein